jgi:FAD/FMN-containing dehydrogenase/Fe-S oxidoreductase
MTPPIAPFDRLAAALDGEVHDGPIARQLHATDASIFQVTPAAVVFPRHTNDVGQTIRFANRHNLSIHPRGGGSGLCGAALGPGIVIDFARHMHRLLEVDLPARRVTSEPGLRLGELEAALGGSGLFFPPDPSSGEYATLGGMLATNASGAHAVKYGDMADYVTDAEVVLADGQIQTLSAIADQAPADLPPPLAALRRLYLDNRETIENGYPQVVHNVAGYNLRGLVREGRLFLHRLLAGAEGTLGIVTRLTMRLVPRPPEDSLVVAYFDDIIASAHAVQTLLPMGPAGIEVMDRSLLDLARATDERLRTQIPADVDNVLLIEFDAATAQEATHQAETALTAIAPGCREAHLAAGARDKARFWAVRKAAVPILYRLKGERKILALVEDAVVPTDRLVPYFQGIYRIFDENKIPFVTYGHIAKGLLHTRPLLNLKSPRDVDLLRPLADAVFELVTGLGGSVSGEHGDGRLRSAYVRRRYPRLYPLMQQVKQHLDPRGRLNPAIKTRFDPDQMARHLRYGEAYSARETAHRALMWPEGLAAEAEKCHGCSKCTTVTTATRMCPIYKFTRREAAAPKSKANLLRGLISGSLDHRSLFEQRFQDVMALCVMCGSCAHECPSRVNIPKLAAEAKAHYVRRFGATREQRALTGLETAARLTRKLSPLTAPIVERPSMRHAVEKLVGVSRQRRLPAFARRSFFERVAPVQAGGRPRVLYFVGCYAGYVRPEIGEAVVRVLTHLGLTVHVPPQHCCGLPMLSKGMADAARRKVGRNLARWGRLVRQVDHVVVSCSSCGYALMADWADLSGEAVVSRLARKVIHITELIGRHRHHLTLKEIKARAAYHLPCHLKIQPAADSSLRLLESLPGLSVQNLNSHCCGMIGSWGMSAANVALSRRIGSMLIERLAAAPVAVGVTDCPTCRMQMEQWGTRPVRHPVELVAQRLMG